MIKRKYIVTVTKEVEIEMHPQYDDPAFQAAEVAEFNSAMFKVDSFDEILMYAAQQLARHDVSFVEGVGGVALWGSTAWKNEPHSYDAVMDANVEVIDTEAECIG
jgi:hypothetical protein